MDEPKKIENDKEQVDKKKIEVSLKEIHLKIWRQYNRSIFQDKEENGESENTQEGVKINNKERS